MTERFVFRQIDFEDLPLFLSDGEVRSKNHLSPQLCHQTSYVDIVNRRGSDEFAMPNGGVVNDYVPFYFSPYTSFTSSIYKGIVDLRAPDGSLLGKATQDRRIFLVGKCENINAAGLQFYFSDFALNSKAMNPQLCNDISSLGSHIHWDVFDENPRSCKIEQIGYEGACKYFFNRDTPARYQNRKEKRMAEFLVKDSFPIELVECVVVKDAAMLGIVTKMLFDAKSALPVYQNQGCFF